MIGGPSCFMSQLGEPAFPSRSVRSLLLEVKTHFHIVEILAQEGDGLEHIVAAETTDPFQDGEQTVGIEKQVQVLAVALHL